MLRHYLKTALRSLLKRKLYTLISVFGLSIGLAFCLIVFGHIAFELSFEETHKKGYRVFRVNNDFVSEARTAHSVSVMPPLGPVVASEIPEVEQYALLRHLEDFDLSVNDNDFKAGKLIYATPGLFDVFTLPMVQGDPTTALDEPFSLLVTEAAAGEYFDGNPLGEIVRVNNTFDCKITGILAPIPENTQLHCEFVLSYRSLELMGEDIHSWDQFGQDFLFLLLHEGANPDLTEEKIRAVLERHLDSESAKGYGLYLQHFPAIHMGPFLVHEPYIKAELSLIYSYGLVALSILILAVANYVNLSTVRAAERSREVAMRKVVGATRVHLVRQFLGETIIITTTSVIAGLIVYELFKHNVHDVLPRKMFTDFFQSPRMILMTVALAIMVSLGAGFYPAFYLSRFEPLAVLHKKSTMKSSRSLLRKALVVFQFAVALVFVCMTTMNYRQLTFVLGMDLGFDTANMLVLECEGDEAAQTCGLLKNEMQKLPGVISLTRADRIPGRRSHTFQAYHLDEDLKDERIIVKAYATDADFLRTFDLQLIEGRDFTNTGVSSRTDGVIIDKGLADRISPDGAVGARLYTESSSYEVIGVVDEFYGASLDWTYRPCSVIRLKPETATQLAVKIAPNQTDETIDAIRDLWATICPGLPVEFQFLEDAIRANYSDYHNIGRVFLTFAIVSMTIACLGIFALVGYTAQQRTKEIGIRKVLGSSVEGIVGLLAREFILLIALSTVIASPIAYLLMQSMLQQFPIRARFGPETFVIPGVAAILLAVLTACTQAIKAANTDPVESLRYE